MGWVKDGERIYRDGDKGLIKHTRTFRLELGAPRLILKSEVDWKLEEGDAAHLQRRPSIPKSPRLIEATAAHRTGERIRTIEGEGRDWTQIAVTLYRATEDLKTVDLSKPDIETDQP